MRRPIPPAPPLPKPIVEIMIPSGVIVDGESEDDTVTLAGDVYVMAHREECGSWLYAVGERLYRCAGGLAHPLTTTAQSGDSNV